MGPLGSWRPRFEIYDTTRMQVARELRSPDFGLTEFSLNLAWTPTGLVLAGWDGAGHGRLVSVHLDDGGSAPLAVDPAFLDAHPWALLGAESGRTVYLVVGIAPSARGERPRLRLHALDVDHAAVSPPLLEHEVAQISATSGLLDGPGGWRLSPSGRYWVASELGSKANLELLAIDTGAPTTFECSHIGRVTWLAGDTLVWTDRSETESRLRLWSAATGVRDIRAAGTAMRFHVQPSPDRRRLLVNEVDGDAEWAIPRRGARIYDVLTGVWSEVDGLVAGPLGAWGGPDVLALWTPQGLSYRPLNEK